MSERVFKLDLNDKTYDALVRKAGKYSLTVEELFQNFVGDLTGEQYSNGSDEYDFIDNWLERCFWYEADNGTFLSFLIYELLYDRFVEQAIELSDTVSEYEREKQIFEERKGTDYWKDIVCRKAGTEGFVPVYQNYQEWYDRELEDLLCYEADIEYIKVDLQEIYSEYQEEHPDAAPFQEEIEKVLKWHRQYYPDNSYTTAVEEALADAEPQELDFGMEV